MPGLVRQKFPVEPFPEDLPTHPLLVVDFEQVKAGEQEAIDTLYKACSQLRFFCVFRDGIRRAVPHCRPRGPASRPICARVLIFFRCLPDLKNHGVDPEPVFAIGEDTFDLPQDELMKFEQGDGGMSAGFKMAGANAVDKDGNLDTAYFINVAKVGGIAYVWDVVGTVK